MACNNTICNYDGGDCLPPKADMNSDHLQYEEIEQMPENSWMMSLAYSNGVLSSRYGIAKRPYIHHIPYFMDKRILKQYARAFAAEGAQTTASRFRNGENIALPVVYYNFVMEEKNRLANNCDGVAIEECSSGIPYKPFTLFFRSDNTLC